MRHKQLKLSVVLLFGLGLTVLHAQEKICASGGVASGNAGTVSYSVGQVAYLTHDGTLGSVSEGVQQPYEILIMTGIEEARDINLRVRAYPNPATDYLILEVEEFDISNLSYQLYDVNGKLWQNEIISGNRTHIAIGKLVPASYFLKLIQGNKEVKAFKIIKK